VLTELQGSHSKGAEDLSLLGCDTVLPDAQFLAFCRSTMPSLHGQAVHENEGTVIL